MLDITAKIENDRSIFPPKDNHHDHIHIYFCEDSTTTMPMTDVTYKISCISPWWLPSAILGFFIKKDITQALKKLAVSFKGNPV